MDIGQWIKKLREDKGLSQIGLAQRAESLTQSQLSKIETGRRKITFPDVEVIAKALELPVSALLEQRVPVRKQEVMQKFSLGKKVCHMQGDKTIPFAELINGLTSVLRRDDLTEHERIAVKRAIYLLSTE